MDRLKPISNFLIFLTLLVSCGRNSIPPQECTGIVVEELRSRLAVGVPARSEDILDLYGGIEYGSFGRW